MKLESQAVELVSGGRHLAIGAIELPLFDHVHGVYSRNEFGRVVEFLKSQHG